MADASARSRERWGALATFARRLASSGSAVLPMAELSDLEPHIGALVEDGVLLEGDGQVGFFHENLFDHVLARTFAEDGTSLIEWLESSRQDIPQRADVRRILTYQRGVDRAAYTATVHDLLRRGGIRFLIKDAVLTVMQGDNAPTEGDWEALSPLVADPNAIEHQTALSVVARPRWFDLLDRLGIVLRWLASEEVDERDRATFIIRLVQRDRPERVAALLTPFVEMPGWRDRIRFLLQFAQPEVDRRAFELVRDALSSGVFDDEEGGVASLFWVPAHTLPTARPAWASELLAVYLDRVSEGRARDLPTAMLGAAFKDDDYWSSEFLDALSHAHPRLYAETVLPFVLRVITTSAESPNEDGGRLDTVWSHGYFASARSHRTRETLFTALDSALSELAKTTPRSLRRLSRDLHPYLGFETVRFLLFRAWAANPRQFATEATDALLSEPSPFRSGYNTEPYAEARDLIRAVQPYASPAQLLSLETRIASYTSAWERTPDGQSESGHVQYLLLDAFDEDRLTTRSRRRLAVLRARFGGSDSESRRVVGGIVGPPIPKEATAMMTDSEWLAAIAEYDKDERRGFLIGGAIEQSRVLEEATKEDPERFAALALRFDNHTNSNYFDAVFRGLGDAPVATAPETIFSLLRHAFGVPGRPGARWILRPLGRVAHLTIPDDIIKIAAWYATEDPDPAEDLWRIGREGRAVHYGGDPLTAGINSVRGVAAEVLSVLIWPNGERIEPLRPALLRLANDKSLPVRVCAALAVSSVYRHDRKFGLSLFQTLVKTDDVILAADPVERFVASASGSDLVALRPIIDRMLKSEDDAVREAGGRQAALAALGNKTASDLIKSALDTGDAVRRLGVAQVAAKNVTNDDVSEQCQNWLAELFDDDDSGVRAEAASWCGGVDSAGFRRLHDLARTYVESRAHADNEHWLFHALDETTVPVGDVSLRAVERFLDARREEIGDIPRAASHDAAIAARLAVRAYSSAADAGQREQALELIEMLLAARVPELIEFVGAAD